VCRINLLVEVTSARTCGILYRFAVPKDFLATAEIFDRCTIVFFLYPPPAAVENNAQNRYPALVAGCQVKTSETTWSK